VEKYSIDKYTNLGADRARTRRTSKQVDQKSIKWLKPKRLRQKGQFIGKQQQLTSNKPEQQPGTMNKVGNNRIHAAEIDIK